MKNKITLGHIMTILTMFIWGTTYISTKVLLEAFQPIEILIYRFVIAYIILLIIHPKFQKKIVLKDEVLFFAAGFTGLALYYSLENIALNYTLASNVGLFVTSAPILTAILSSIFIKNFKLSKNLIWGFILAMAGSFLVIFNGNFILKLSPLGDILAILAAMVWAVYSVILTRISDEYNYVYITRKIFFYGIICLIPMGFIFNVNFSFSKILVPKYFLNIAFLSVIASALCFIMWNSAVSILGPVKSSNYIYMVPLITAVTAVFILNEPITKVVVMGAVLILLGLYISQNGFKIKRKAKK